MDISSLFTHPTHTQEKKKDKEKERTAKQRKRKLIYFLTFSMLMSRYLSEIDTSVRNMA